MIESGPIIFPRNCRGQLDELRFAEFFAKTAEQSIAHVDGSARHCIGIFQNKPFEIRKVEIRPVVVEIYDLLGCDAILPADGRANVDSKRTAYESCDTKFS